MKIEDQPAPISTSAQPSWELVVLFAEYLKVQTADPDAKKLLDQVVDDMRERDRVGRERYGTPLQAGNGRNHLVDAYQELLDYAVYLRTHLEEAHADPLRVLNALAGMP